MVFGFFLFFSDFVLLVSFIYVCQKSRRSWCLLMFRYMAIHTLNSESGVFWQMYSFVFSKIYIMRKVKIFFESIYMENDSVE